MRQRMSRSHKSRRGFKIDTILDKLLAKKKQEQNLGVRGYMTLTFLGFYDKRGTFFYHVLPFFFILEVQAIFGEAFRITIICFLSL